jgi:hypothetical protein
MTALRQLPQSAMPELWVSVYDDRQPRAAFVSAAEAVATVRGSFSDKLCVVLDAQLRERWLEDDRAVALDDDFPIHPTRAETELRKLTVRADLQFMSLESGAALYWSRNREILDVVPELYRAEVLEMLGTGRRAL